MFGWRCQQKPECNNGTRDQGLRKAATSSKQESIQQDHQTDFLTGDCEASSQDFQQVAKSEGLDIVEGLASYEMKKETAHRLRAGNVRVSATLDSFALALVCACDQLEMNHIC
jgi:hypothetical protein